MTLRKRLENSVILSSILGGIVGCWLWFCLRTTRWKVEGRDALETALADGPVMYVLWHSRSLLAPAHWPRRAGKLSSLNDTSPIGRVGATVQAFFGLSPVGMAGSGSNRTSSRTVLRRVADGYSIGVAADGPTGPAHQVKDATMGWARATGVPMFCFAFSTTRQRRLGSWDKMLMPLPFGHGAAVFIRLAEDIPRHANPAEVERLRNVVSATLDQANAHADEMIGLNAAD